MICNISLDKPQYLFTVTNPKQKAASVGYDMVEMRPERLWKTGNMPIMKLTSLQRQSSATERPPGRYNTPMTRTETGSTG